MRHMRRLAQASIGLHAIMAGEHQHLPQAAFADLKWLATKLSLDLAGSASIYNRVYRLL